MNKNDLIDIEEKCEKTLKEFGYMMPWFYSIDNTHILELGISSCLKFLLPLIFSFLLQNVLTLFHHEGNTFCLFVTENMYITLYIG